ncbi:MAG: RNA-binding protein [Chloroflexi bacterium]|nr:RNA-binding protein [Chloroflexota bacterium]|tara:strand:+ start:5761 stop:6546 length:786 start_codon:yes stop_codon:yes gene_type:complete
MKQEIENQDMPEVGELVLALVTSMSSHGAKVVLEEYNNMYGFLHVSEIATGWVKNVSRFVTVNQKVVLKVIRVDSARTEVDLSLRQVSGEDRKQKLLSVKRYEKSKSIFDTLQTKLKLTEDQKNEYFDKVEDQFGTVYSGLEDLIRDGDKAFEKLGIPKKTVTELASISKSKISIPMVNVTGIMQVTTHDPNGINLIRDSMSQVLSNKTGKKVEISYLGSPKYKITVYSEDYKSAEKKLSSALEKIKKSIGKKADFSFSKE